jgi:DNA-binding FadR family transcriptional regulator
MAKSIDFTTEQVQIMAKRYSEGEGLSSLSKDFGVSVPTVRKYIKAHVEIRPRGRPKVNPVTPTVTVTVTDENGEDITEQTTVEFEGESLRPHRVVEW